MFGWEFPPFSSGGLGTACYGLTKSLSKKGVDITFVLPSADDTLKSDFLRLISTKGVRIRGIRSLLTPYMSVRDYRNLRRARSGAPNIYGATLFDEVYRYTEAAADIAKQETFDLIHCHDWMTFGAGIKAKKISGKPLAVHVHATEFDRTGGNNVNEYVYRLERNGMEAADVVIAVSNFTKNKIVQHYGINPEKIVVVHNAVEITDDASSIDQFVIKKHDRVVLFVGRITLQKGPDYFIYAAKKVLEHEPNVKFIMVGTGDMEMRMIEKAAELGIADRVLFTGFLGHNDLEKVYRMADVYVMPSVSEPFGITPLEAMRNGVPTIISKQSGVSEVIKNCLLVDFWDINELTNKIVAVLRYRTLGDLLKEDALREVKKITWDKPADKCISVYNKLLKGVQ